MRSQLSRYIVTGVLMVLACCGHSFATACSSAQFMWGDTSVMIRSYDWRIGNALIIINKRDMAKRALSFDNPAEWTSKYGSVTINQYGRELPNDGMNEAGLAVTCLWLDESEYPASDERPSVSTAQWIQYQLDTASTVKEVLESDKHIRITPVGGAKVHYFVSDAEGNSAVIEFVKGKMVAHSGESLPNRLITNNLCSVSAEDLTQVRGFGGDRALSNDSASLSRYARLATLLKNLKPTSQPFTRVGFDMLDRVKQHGTQWQIVYDLSDKQIHFRTREHQQVRTVDLADCNFSPSTPTQVLDIDAKLKGNVIAEFKEYTREANRALIEFSVAKTPLLENIPRYLVNVAIAYPEFNCKPAEVPVAAGGE
ncbi:linear amide C-N hydrolase [Aeoliella mucimassa]|uniref:Linear amide C-N hydrolase, choloylglycine hydrolase family n=1 Tax=Aeoliella mucimassa TaxID=2527972 RepID=A0A518ASD0_9BACT|nr:linear amide C-N hydrolase [Aeoliella mucimassa]QDU57624.1 Linear amide C-N hydrolase, choloylglycine hydrolase family [Aeoliella mucimassa]